MFDCPIKKFNTVDEEEDNDVLHICLNCRYSTVEDVFKHWGDHCGHEDYKDQE